MTASRRTRIKICGVRDMETARCAVDSGADALGFVFAETSPRFIPPERAWRIVSQLPPLVASVGLTVDADVQTFSDIEVTCPTDFSQLHGNEPENVVRACGPRVIKAVRFDEATIDHELSRWAGVEEVDAILVDGSAGGMGHAFDWRSLAEPAARFAKPLLLAGGLTPENVGEAILAVRPFAVDVSSGVEQERGFKDPALIRAFCEAVRQADAAVG